MIVRKREFTVYSVEIEQIDHRLGCRGVPFGELPAEKTHHIHHFDLVELQL